MATPAIIGAGVGGVVLAILTLIGVCCLCRKRSAKKKERRKFALAKRQAKVQIGPPPSAQLRTETLTEEEPIEHGHVGGSGDFVIEQQQSMSNERGYRKGRGGRMESTLSMVVENKRLVSQSTLTGSLPRGATMDLSKTDRRQSEYNPLDVGRRERAEADDTDSLMDAESLIMSLRHHSEALDDEPDGEAKLGRLQFRLEYCYDRNSIRLHLIRAENLPAKDLRGTSDPFLKVYLVDMRQLTLAGQVKLGKPWRTRTHPQTLNPDLDEYHDFECPTIAAAQHLGFLMHIYDYDRFSRNDIIGHVWFPLKGTDLSDIPTFWKNIKPGKLNKAGKEDLVLGELQVAIGYQRAQRQLTVLVRHCRNLPKVDDMGSADPFVKVSVLFNGQVIAKKQTETKSRTLNPIFNKSFSFKMMESVALENISIVCKVLHRDSRVHRSTIGYVTIGEQTVSESGRQQWKEMLRNERAIENSVWHRIQSKKAA